MGDSEMVKDAAFGILKNLAESDDEGNIVFRGSAVDIIQAINELNAAEHRLTQLIQNAITVEYDND